MGVMEGEGGGALIVGPSAAAGQSSSQLRLSRWIDLLLDARAPERRKALRYAKA
jgi:hypothetical protein